MKRRPCPEAELLRRRAAFGDLLIRADLGPSGQCERLLNEAVTIAALHHELTGAPLVPDLATYPGLAGRLPRLRVATAPPPAASADAAAAPR